MLLATADIKWKEVVPVASRNQSQAIGSPCTNLMRTNFAGKHLPGADFGGVLMDAADFSGADLTGANFQGTARCRWTKFDGARMDKASLGMVDCTGASFDGASLAGASEARYG